MNPPRPAGERPLVTAIMAVFNGEAFLAEALESMLSQDYPRVEFVVCNDGSTDATGAILASHPSVRVVDQPNLGVSTARNTAIAAARGDFLALFDADDLWPPHRLSLQARYLFDHPEVGCVLGRQEWIDPPPWLGRDVVYGDLGGIPLATTFLRREVMDEVGGYDPAFRRAGDTDLVIRMREHGIGIGIMPEVVLYRRFHGANLTALGPSSTGLIDSLRGKLARDRGSRSVRPAGDGGSP